MAGEPRDVHGGSVARRLIRDISDLKYDNMNLQFLYCPRPAGALTVETACASEQDSGKVAGLFETV